MQAAIGELRRCFAARPAHIARSSHAAAGGELLIMPAVDESAAGIKLLMIQPANAFNGRSVIQGAYLLFAADRGQPVALLDGAALTRLRTPAASAVATDALARPDAATLGIVGSGPQAIAHVDAMLCVRPGLDRIVVASRSSANASAAVEQIAADRALSTLADGRRRTAVTGAYAQAAACDIVCVATRSIEPLITRAMVHPGAHVNAVGSYRADMRELSADLIAATTVAVDELHAAQVEAGDLIHAVVDGGWSWDRVAGDLADLSDGTLRRTSANEITLFKSVGLAIEDLVIARLVAAGDGLL